MAVTITGSSFDDLNNALKKVSAAATKVNTKIDSVFNKDWTGTRLFSSLNSLSAKLTIINVKAINLASSLKAVAAATKGMTVPRVPTPRQSTGSTGGASRGSGFVGPEEILRKQQRETFFRRLVLENLFGFKSSSLLNGGVGNPLFVSKFGNPGQMPLVTRFRVFQRPFPGSERNPFALGDTGNVLNNAVYASGRSLEMMFRGITTAGTDSIRALSGITQVGLAFAASAVKKIPIVGDYLAGAFTGLSKVVELGSRSLAFFVDKLGEAVGGIINFGTNLALGLSGLAYRAVNAASSLTELKNAAAIYVGRGASSLVGTAMDYQARFGLSATDSLRIMTRVAGQVRQTTGASGEAASADAIEIFKAATEAGSVLNMTIDDIGKTIQSALAGRYTPLRRIGVAVSAPYLDMIAKTQGLTENAKTPFEARTKALISEIKRQTAPFMGDLQATQYEFANQQRKLMGLFESIFVQAGRILEPFAKALLIVSNDTLTLLNDRLRTFADTIKPNAGGILGRFTLAVARAADYVVELGNRIWEARQRIADALVSAADMVLMVSKNLIVFSLRVISVFGQLAEAVLNILPSLKDMTASMASAAEFFARQTGFQTSGQKAANAAYQEDESLVRSARIEANKFRLNSSNQLTPEKLVALQKQAKIAQARIDQVQAGMPRTFVYNGGASFDFAKGAANLGVLADKVQAINTKEGLQDFLKQFMGDVPKVISDPLEKILTQVNRDPNFKPLPEMTPEERGSLVSYFSPAAYRDEVQNRQLSAMEKVAVNTDRMVEILDRPAVAGTVGAIGVGVTVK